MPAKAATTTTSVEAPVTPDPSLEAAAAHIRRRAARESIRCADSGTPAGLTEALTLLKHLHPGHSETAIYAHRALVREARSLLREYGFPDDWFDLINGVHDFLQVSGWSYSGGRWITEAEEAVEFGARMRAANLRGERSAAVS